MGFRMNVSSCQVTACAGDIGAKAAPYISSISTNREINSANLEPVLKGSAFPAANVGIVLAQQVPHMADPSTNGKA